MPDDGLDLLLERLKAIQVEPAVVRDRDDGIIQRLEKLRNMIPRPAFFRPAK